MGSVSVHLEMQRRLVSSGIRLLLLEKAAWLSLTMMSLMQA